MLDLPHNSINGAKLCRRGIGLPLVRAENDNSSGDSTDAEEADVNAAELLTPQRSEDVSGRPTWDPLALRALGLQEIGNVIGSELAHHTASEGIEDFGTQELIREPTGGEFQQPTKGRTGGGIQRASETLTEPKDASKNTDITYHFDTGKQAKKKKRQAR